MIHNASVSARPLSEAGERLPTWDDARARLEGSQFYWVATVRSNGRPHVMPVLGVWVDDRLHFVAGPASRKARNLTLTPYCVVSVDAVDLHLVVEGEARLVRDDRALRRAADAYAKKYGWEVAVRDGAFHGDGAPTAGPPPYEVYALTPTVGFAFGTDDTFGATRSTFEGR